MDLSAIALRGLDQAQAKLEKSAARLASSGALSPDGDTVDLSAEVVALLSAKNAFAAGIKVLRTADEMQRQTIDLLA